MTQKHVTAVHITENHKQHNIRDIAGYHYTHRLHSKSPSYL